MNTKTSSYLVNVRGNRFRLPEHIFNETKDKVHYGIPRSIDGIRTVLFLPCDFNHPLGVPVKNGYVSLDKEVKERMALNGEAVVFDFHHSYYVTNSKDAEKLKPKLEEYLSELEKKLSQL